MVAVLYSRAYRRAFFARRQGEKRAVHRHGLLVCGRSKAKSLPPALPPSTPNTPNALKSYWSPNSSAVGARDIIRPTAPHASGHGKASPHPTTHLNESQSEKKGESISEKTRRRNNPVERR